MSKTEKVEEGDDAHSSSEEEHGHDHDHVHDQNCDHDNKDGKKGNKGEKKFKKAMSKMGLKPVSGINRVTLKKGKAFTMSIDDPDVWKSPGA
jgi:nascent polypeptide-associated complex subunit alpha